MSETLTVQPPATAELYRQSTDVAGVCKDIVLKTAMSIQGRKYVRVEGWQSIATAHGCCASARDVERVEGGFRAIGEIRNMQTGQVIATAEGFVGEDEPTWFGGETKGHPPKTLPKRADYAIRAMCQTRAISRACRTAFAHVVVLMDANLSTTPAEEVPDGGFEDAKPVEQTKPAPASASTQPENPIDWRKVTIHFGKNHGAYLGALAEDSLRWYVEKWQPKPFKGQISSTDEMLRRALDRAGKDMFGSGEPVTAGTLAPGIPGDDEIPF